MDLPHRGSDLEILSLNLQLGEYKSPVEAVIDEHKANLPAQKDQTDADRIWRLALHRMDFRSMTKKEILIPDVSGDGKSPRKAIAYQSKEVDKDVQEMIDGDEPSHQQLNEDAGLYNWAVKAFRGEKNANVEEDGWRERLSQAKAYETDAVAGKRSSLLSLNAPRFAATVFVRYHWDELSVEDKKWCLEAINEAIAGEADEIGDQALITQNPIDPSRSGAYCLSLVLAKKPSLELESLALTGLATALTHSNREVNSVAAKGVGDNLWKGNRELARHIVYAMARRANEIDRLLHEDDETEYRRRKGYFSISAEVNREVRTSIQAKGSVSAKEVDSLNLLGEFARFDPDSLLSLLRGAGTEPTARQMLKKAVAAVIHWWNVDRKGGRESERVPHSQISTILDCVAHYSLRVSSADAITLCTPIVEEVDKHYREVATFVRDLVVAEDQLRSGEGFWLLWQEFANRVKKASWLKHLSTDYRGYDELLGAIFLVLPWAKEGIHWPPLDGHARRVEELALALPVHNRILDQYVLFLYYVGQTTLPAAFMTVVAIVKKGDSKTLLSDPNTEFCLVKLLQQQIYGNPRQLKENKTLRETVLELLDALVEAGSSSAYRMRDDFVTPLGA